MTAARSDDFFRANGGGLGQVRVSNELQKRGLSVSPGGVRSICLRHDLKPRRSDTKVAQEGIVMTESQVAALEAAKLEKEAHGEIETEHPGYLGSQDTFYGIVQK